MLHTPDGNHTAGSLYESLVAGGPACARQLLGGLIQRTLPSGDVLCGRIVETEYYDQTDPASHTYGGKTTRNAAMFGPAGHAYVYFSYGVHWCFNVTAGADGYGAGVLIRAVEPVEGIDTMRRLRGERPDRQLTNGPGKLTQALAIDKSLYGHDLRCPPLEIMPSPKAIDDSQLMQTTRIGISRARDMPWRFYVADSQFVSKR